MQKAVGSGHVTTEDGSRKMFKMQQKDKYARLQLQALQQLILQIP